MYESSLGGEKTLKACGDWMDWEYAGKFGDFLRVLNTCPHVLAQRARG